MADSTKYVVRFNSVGAHGKGEIVEAGKFGEADNLSRLVKLGAIEEASDEDVKAWEATGPGGEARSVELSKGDMQTAEQAHIKEQPGAIEAEGGGFVLDAPEGASPASPGTATEADAQNAASAKKGR